MQFKAPLIEAVLIKRYFRFLVDVILNNKKKRTVYCPNLGVLTHCDVLGSRIWVSNPTRLSQGCLEIWELVEVNGGWLVCVNPEHAEILAREAIELGIIPELAGFRFLQIPIVPRLGHGIELLLKENGEQCFIHVEPVLFGDDRRDSYFPEEKGAGLAALLELIALKEHGHRALLLYCIQHNGASSFRPSDVIDPEYGRVLREAVAKGVEVMAYRTQISLHEITLETKVPVLLSENITSR